MLLTVQPRRVLPAQDPKAEAPGPQTCWGSGGCPRSVVSSPAAPCPNPGFEVPGQGELSRSEVLSQQEDSSGALPLNSLPALPGRFQASEVLLGRATEQSAKAQTKASDQAPPGQLGLHTGSALRVSVPGSLPPGHFILDKATHKNPWGPKQALGFGKPPSEAARAQGSASTLQHSVTPPACYP